MPSPRSPDAPRRVLRSGGALLGSLLLGACSVVGIRSFTPQPHYTVIETIGRGADAVEIRSYASRLAAETTETGSEVSARYTGFRRLAGFIFGNNDGDRHIAMTAPVVQTAARPSSSSPVAALPAADGRWTIRFFLPDTMTASQVPTPRDPSIRIVTVPPDMLAVLRFSGTPDPASVATHQRALLSALNGTHWHATGSPQAWFYDPPWTLPPLRRNEIVVAVARDPGA